MRFVDEVEVVLESGAGGAGMISFRREAHVPRGGPDGGDGGDGGSLILRATRARNTLVDFRRNKVYAASRGRAGGKTRCRGARGADLVLEVPVGTLVFDAETGERLADLDAEGEVWSLPGGQGGRGNPHFKTSTRRTPRMADDGRPGARVKVRLELKLIAEVGLIGFPNAGKSTLISRLSAARPRVADYPFTTLTPNLGVVSLGNGESFVVADVPGLIEGAHQGAGLGHQFLKHVERCGVLLHLVSGAELDVDPVYALQALNEELTAYDASLLERPRLVVLTKTDAQTPEAVEASLEALREVASAPVFAISSVTGAGLPKLVECTWKLLEERRRAEAAAEEAPDVWSGSST